MRATRRRDLIAGAAIFAATMPLAAAAGAETDPAVAAARAYADALQRWYEAENAADAIPYDSALRPSLDGAAAAANGECDRLFQILRETPAMTSAGLLAKMRLAAEFDDFEETAADPDNRYVAPRLLVSVLADLERLAKGGAA